MLILNTPVAAELMIKNSRFLAEIFPIENQTDARTLLKAQKLKHSDSSHVVHAFIAGKKAEILGMSDDGEPPGTAARPALDVLKGSGCTNILLTISRWFGGTLLGTGGLVKAYSDSAKAVMALAQTRPLVERIDFTVLVSYEHYEAVKRFLTSLDISSLTEDFAQKISLRGLVALKDSSLLSDKIRDLTRAQGTVLIGL